MADRVSGFHWCGCSKPCSMSFVMKSLMFSFGAVDLEVRTSEAQTTMMRFRLKTVASVMF